MGGHDGSRLNDVWILESIPADTVTLTLKSDRKLSNSIKSTIISTWYVSNIVLLGYSAIRFLNN